MGEVLKITKSVFKKTASLVFDYRYFPISAQVLRTKKMKIYFQSAKIAIFALQSN